jgi:hypothetical protein
MLEKNNLTKATRHSKAGAQGVDWISAVRAVPRPFWTGLIIVFLFLVFCNYTVAYQNGPRIFIIAPSYVEHGERGMSSQIRGFRQPSADVLEVKFFAHAMLRA